MKRVLLVLILINWSVSINACILYGNEFKVLISFVESKLEYEERIYFKNFHYPVVKINYIPVGDTCGIPLYRFNQIYKDSINILWQSLIKKIHAEWFHFYFGRKKGNVCLKCPVVLVASAPNYPRKALIAKIEGWVKIEFIIDKQGNVIKPKVIEAKPQNIFDKEALRTILRYRFKPKVVNGVATHQIVTKTIEFRIAK